MVMGRPKKWTKERVKQTFNDLSEYINKEDYPTLIQFAANNGLWKTWFYDYPDFSEVLKKGKTKCEAWLQKQVLEKSNCTPFIFLLKAVHGYRDSTPIEITSTTNTVRLELGNRSLDELQEAMLKQGKANKMKNTRKVKGT